SHVVNKKLDKSGMPASLSKDIISILNNNYNYQGLIVSDDLQMKAISNNFDLKETLKLAILSGNDILIFGNQIEYEPTIAKKVIKIVKNLVEKNVIPEERIVKSYNKIVKLKKWIS
ncbi:MAG: glycoside hydrolase family 3, partial [Legionellales bacterium]|nr:glycoside hydrolase family 3 [Legionellales bacterium]